MGNIVKKFNDFINEDLNYEKYENECILIRNWYYYNPDDEIIYGSNSRPSGDYPIIFSMGGNGYVDEFYLDGDEFSSDTDNTDGAYLLIYDNSTMSTSLLTNISEISGELKSLGLSRMKNGYEMEAHGEEIQNAFDETSEYKMMLFVRNSLIASSFDIIEQN